MAARSGYFECPLNTLLPFHIGKVVLIVVQMVGKFGAGVHIGGFHQLLAVKMVDNLLEIVGAIHFQIVDNGSFAGILLRYDDAFELLSPGLDGNGQNTLYRAQAAVQRKLTHNDILVQVVGPHIASRGQYSYGNSEVIGCPFLFQVGGSHIHHHLLSRNMVSILPYGGSNALLALLHRAIGQTHQKKVHPYTYAHLHSNHDGIDPANGTAECFD